MAAKRACPVISIPKISWEEKTQPWMSLFLLLTIPNFQQLEVVVVAHQGELRPFVNGPVLSCFENTGWGIGSSRPAWASWWAHLWAKRSPAWAGQWQGIFFFSSRPWEQSQQTLGFSGQFWGEGTIAILFHWYFLFPAPAYYPHGLLSWAISYQDSSL